MQDRITATLYYGYLSLENGDESPPVLVASAFYAGDAQFRFQHNFGITPPSIGLDNGHRLYVATENRESCNPEQHQQLLLKFQNNNLNDPEDWVFSREIDFSDREQSILLRNFSENRVKAFLLCPEKAPGHPETLQLASEF